MMGGEKMARCKACNSYMPKEAEFCAWCERALRQLNGYAFPVVLCKDCKKHGNDEECPLLSMMQYTDETDFCSYGERKDND